MKLLVFAHVPPPHHGQSYMVKLLLDGLGGDCRHASAAGQATAATDIACYHVNARYSDDLEDVGSFRWEKIWLVFRYCAEALWCRLRYGVRTFYYVPAPGKRGALYRDWLVMLICRPFFRHFIHHWHAVGLGDWLREEGTWLERWITHRLLGHPTLGLALAIPSMRDALWFRSSRVEIVPNGIPDPCPDFDTAVAPRRRARIAARRQLLAGEQLSEAESLSAGGDPEILRVFFLAHCLREKGIFDTVDGVLAANESLRERGLPLSMHLTVAGAFINEDEELEFRARVARDPGTIHYAGFVRDRAKLDLLTKADVFCFPTYYAVEGQPVNLIEAIAFGLPVVTTRWRAVPEMLPADYAGFVPPRSPSDVATALLAAATSDSTALRTHFLSRFTLHNYLDEMQKQLWTLSEDS